MELLTNEEIVWQGNPSKKLILVKAGVSIFLTIIFYLFVFVALFISTGFLIKVFVIINLSFLLVLMLLIYYFKRIASFNFFITSSRIIFEGGIIQRHKKNIPLNKIRNVMYSQTFWERILGLWNIHFQSGGSGLPQIIFEGIADIDEAKNFFMKIT